MKHIGEGVKMGRDVKVWHFTYIGDETIIGARVRRHGSIRSRSNS